ncbi:MAG: response regulator [Acidobacteriota bacterium]
MDKPKILVVEDESIIAMDLKLKLEQQGYDVVAIASSADDAVQATKKYKPELILMDILLKGEKTGIEASEQIQKQMDIPIICMTGNMHLLDSLNNKNFDFFKVLGKPPSEWELFDSIEKALNR